MVSAINQKFPEVSHHVCVKETSCVEELRSCRNYSLQMQRKCENRQPSDVNYLNGKIDIKSECSPHTKFFFLKTSKTGSTTIANIFTRFGYKHDLTALMGESGNGNLFFVNGFLPFHDSKCYLGKDIKPQVQFDLSFVHLRYFLKEVHVKIAIHDTSYRAVTFRYHKETIERIMDPSHKKVSILRNPESNFISSFRYYKKRSY